MIIHNAIAQLLGAVPFFRPGHVWIAGAGPGDPGHLTLHAAAGLAQADAIVHDALVDERILAMGNADAIRVFAGKRGGKPSLEQAEITARLIELARSGLRVLRLKGGDPFVFGRGGEEALALARAGVPFRVIPGVTSGLAGLAMASIPATMRGINHAVILATGHGGEHGIGPDWEALGRLGHPLILYMAMRTLGPVSAGLMAGGMAPETPVAVIEQASLPQERVLVSTLDRVAAEAEAQAFAPPAIVAVGDIVTVRAELLSLVQELEGEVM